LGRANRRRAERIQAGPPALSQFAGNQLEIRQFCLSGSQDPRGTARPSGRPRRKQPRHRDVFRLAVSATRDNRVILEMVPPQASVFFDYLNFEMEAGDVTAAEQVWLRLLQLKLPFDLRQTFLSRRAHPTPRARPPGRRVVGTGRTLPHANRPACKRLQFGGKREL